MIPVILWCHEVKGTDAISRQGAGMGGRAVCTCRTGDPMASGRKNILVIIVLLLSLCILPVISSGAVSIVSSGTGTYSVGDHVMFSGVCTHCSGVSLVISGGGIAPGTDLDQGRTKSLPVQYDNTWSYGWTADQSHGYAINPGMYTVTAYDNDDKSQMSSVSIFFPSGIQAATTTKTPAPTPVPVDYSVGSLGITSSPPGADIYVDDTYRGVTPLLVGNLTPGVHVVRIAKAGYTGYMYTAVATGGKSSWRATEVVLTPGTEPATPPADPAASGTAAPVQTAPVSGTVPTTAVPAPGPSAAMIVLVTGVSAGYAGYSRLKGTEKE